MAKVSKRVTKERVRKICDILNETYTTEYKCYLNHENAWQLLIATMLSAQCTDARVNIVTEKLFKKYTSLDAFAKADLKELERDIYSTGFYKNKAKNIIGAASQILERHGGEVPEHRRIDCSGRCGKENSQCDPRQYFPRTQHRGGHPREKDI